MSAATSPGEFARLLTDAALAGAGAAGLVGDLGRFLGATCRLVTPSGVLLAASDRGPGVDPESMRSSGEHVTATDGWTGIAVVLAVGPQPRRVLLVDLSAGSAGVEVATAARTALLIDEVRAVEQRGPAVPPPRAEAIIAALRHGTASPGIVSAARKADLLGDDPRSAAVLHYGGPRQRAWHTALSWLDHPVEVDGDHAWTLVRNIDRLRALRRSLSVTVGDDRVTVAGGSAGLGPGGLPGSFIEARRLLAVARRSEIPVLGYEDAGVLQVLLTAPRERIEQFVASSLGPVLNKPELLQTLRAWLAESGSRQSVSELLHLHRNSVGYRVRRLKDLLGVDPLAPVAATQLHLALTAWDLICAEDAGAEARHSI